MKRFTLLLSLVSLVLILAGCVPQDVGTTTEPYSLSFTFIDDYMYDLNDGSYTPNNNFATSSREIVYSDAITVSDYTKISYMLFWGESNDYIGYYKLDGIDDVKDGYLGNISGNTITFPTGTNRISVQVNKTGEDGYFKVNSASYLSYTYTEVITQDDDYVIESIDDNISVVDGYETLTYRDVLGDPTQFGGSNNILENGDFTDYTNILVNTRNIYDLSSHTWEDGGFNITVGNTWAENKTTNPLRVRNVELIPVLPNTTYTLSINNQPLIKDIYIRSVAQYDDTATPEFTGTYDSLLSESGTITTTSNTYHLGVTLYYYDDSDISITDFTDVDDVNLQIEIGSNVSDYVGYEVYYDRPDNWNVGSYRGDFYVTNGRLYVKEWNATTTYFDQDFSNLSEGNYYLSYDTEVVGTSKFRIWYGAGFFADQEYTDEIVHHREIRNTGTNPMLYFRPYDINGTVPNEFYFDNFYLYNLDDVFDGYTIPTDAQFEDMIDEYERLNQFGDGEITLLDLTTTLGTIENGLYDSGNWGNTLDAFDNEGVDYYDFDNLISNGNMSDDTNSDGHADNWNGNYGIESTSEIINGKQHWTKTDLGGTGTYRFWKLFTINAYNIYYHNYEAQTVPTDYIFDTDYGQLFRIYLNDSPYTVMYNRTFTSDNYLYNESNIVTSNISGNANLGFAVVNWNDPDFAEGKYIIDNVNMFNLLTNEYWLNQNPNEAYNPTFTDDTDSDGIADYWTSYGMTNESVFGGQQYGEASGTLTHFFRYTTNDDYTIGDYITASITIEDTNTDYVSIQGMQKGADGVPDSMVETGCISVSDGDVLTIEFQTDDKHTSPELLFTVFLCDSLGAKSYTAGTENIKIDHMEWRNIGDKSFTATKTFIDDVLDEYNYIDGSMYVPDPNDTDLDGNFDFADVTNGLSFGESTMYYNQDDIGTILPTAIYSWSQTDITTWLSIYYDDDWNSTTNYSYGDNYDTLDVLNPIAFSAIFEYSDMLEENTERDYIIDLYYDYKNGVHRWEWFTEFGVTSDIYDEFYEEWQVQNTPENTNSLSNLQSVSYSGTRTINDYTPSTIDDTINDSLDEIGAEGTFAYIAILFIVIVLTVIGLIVGKAGIKVIMFSVIMELFVFTVLGWISEWIILVLGTSLFIALILTFRGRGGSSE